MEKSRTKVVVGPQEEELAKKAEKMLKAGKQSFDSVYGSTAPFDPAADKAAMEAAFGSNTDIPESRPVDPINVNSFQTAQIPVQSPSAIPQIPTSTNLPEQSTEDSEASEEKVPKIPTEPVERVKYFCAQLKLINSHAPEPQTVLSWKQIHGNVFLINFEEYTFLYRYLKRQEFMQFKANPQFENMTEDQVEEKIFDKCVLWPRLDSVQLAALPAGAITMVVQQIRLQSLFLDPGFVAQTTIKM